MEGTLNISSTLKSKYLIACYCLFALIYIGITGRWQSDFFIYISASKDLFLNKDIFTATYADGYHYYYSMLFAILIYPLSFLPIVIAQYIWLLINAFLMWRIVLILGRYFNLSVLSVKTQWLFVALCLGFTAYLALSNIYVHQITICILFLILQGLEYIFSGKKITGALLIALGINFKLLPVVIIPYLLFRKEFKATAYIIAAYAILLLLPVLVLGNDRNNFLLISWWHLINPANGEHMKDVSQRGFMSLTSFLSIYLSDVPSDKFELQTKRNIIDLSLAQLSLVINIVRLAFVAFSFYFLRTRPFFSRISKAHRYWEISYILLITPLIFPHQQHYSFLFAIPAVWHILYYFLKNYESITTLKRVLMVTALSISFFAINASFILGEFRPFYEHYKTLTIGILLLVPLLAISVPDMEVVE